MKTEALIRILAADAARPAPALRPLMSAALLAGSAISLALFSLLFDLRVDFATAIRGHAFVLKLTVVACLAASAASLLVSMARPLPPRRPLARFVVVPLVLLTAVLVELTTVPPGDWLPRAVGRNALHCLGAIPLLSAAPALFLFAAFRRGAPARAAQAGAIAGLAAGGIGACLYALACPDDSPLFVAAWYAPAVGLVVAACAWAGRRWLRW